MSPEVLLALVLLSTWGALHWRSRATMAPTTPAVSATCAAQGALRCRAPRAADGAPDHVRALVFHEVVRHPNHLGGPIVADLSGRAPWRPITVGCDCARPGCLSRRPLCFVVTWGHA